MRPNTLRIAQLREALESAVEALHHRRASAIPDGFIEDFVSLNWLRWNGGSLGLTPTGDDICRQMRERIVDNPLACASTEAGAGLCAAGDVASLSRPIIDRHSPRPGHGIR